MLLEIRMLNGDADVENMGRGRVRSFSLAAAFQAFLCVCLSILLGLNTYTYWGAPPDISESISDMKEIVMQLRSGLSQVHRKHARLQADIERVSSALPAVAAAAARAEQAIEPALVVNPADYDRQMSDFALESAGGRVLDTGDTVGHFIYEGPISWTLRLLTTWACHECQAARAIIQPAVLPGECWAFKGERGEAVIRLLGTVHITGLSLEHIPPHIDPANKALSAPRKFQLEGLRSRYDASPHNFGTFEYDKNGSPIQHFDVTWPATQGYHIVRFKVLSNWGHPVYTCVYRVRIHGDLVPGQVPISRPSIGDGDEASINSGL